MAQNIDRQELAMRYVLGTLSEEEKARLDHRFFADDVEFEELEIAEEELVDRYVRNELSVENTRQLETVLESSPRLRGRVEFARILARKVAAPNATRPVTNVVENPSPKEEKNEDPKVPWWRVWDISTAAAPALRIAFASSLVLMMLATVGLFMVWSRWVAESQRLALEQQQRQQKEQEIAAEQARIAKLQDQLKKAGEENQQISTQNDELNQRLQQLQQQQQEGPSFLPAMHFLQPGGGRRGPGGGGTQVLHIAAKAPAVHLNLDVGEGGDEYATYNASLKDVNTRVVAQREGLTPFPSRGSTYIRLQVATKSLPPGTYTVEVEGVKGSGEREPLRPFVFRVAR